MVKEKKGKEKSGEEIQKKEVGENEEDMKEGNDGQGEREDHGGQKMRLSDKNLFILYIIIIFILNSVRWILSKLVERSDKTKQSF